MMGFFGRVCGACLAATLWAGASHAAEQAATVDEAAIRRAVDEYLSAAAAEGQELPLIELPCSYEQAMQRMADASPCAEPAEAAEEGAAAEPAG